MTCWASRMAKMDAVCISVILVANLGLHVQAVECPSTCPPENCDNVTGNCVVEWIASGDFKLVTDKTECPDGFYGEECGKTCPPNCHNSTCQMDTGQCTHGCLIGYTGEDCSTECSKGFYGPNCLLPCSTNCRQEKCNPQTGVCLEGCMDGFWGSDCSLGVELTRSSQEERRNFYKHLSAESKSVLLYMLASQYEHQLSRAQFEIERAVQRRNEIQHVLSDLDASKK